MACDYLCSYSAPIICPLHYAPIFPPQLVEADARGCNVWVMREAGGLSSDLLPTGHLRQKVHAQQSTACSKDKPTYELDIMPLRIAGMYVRIVSCDACTILL